MRKIVVIGGGAAGFKAAARARRRDEMAEITVIEKSRHISVCRCGMPYFIAGLIHEIENLQETPYGVIRDEDYFRRVKNITVLKETEAKRIDRKEKVVEVEQNGLIEEIPYDYLVLTTGSTSSFPQIPGINSKGVFWLTNPSDALTIVDYWEKEDISDAVVIGSGPTGMECAEAFRLGMSVTVIEIMSTILPQLLDAEMSLIVQKHLHDNGVKVMTDCTVREITSDGGKVSGVKTENGFTEAQLVLIAAGIRPDVSLAKDAGLEVGKAIKVNSRLQTTDPYVFAGGDCVENINLITGKTAYTPLGSVASKHGRVIGDNVTGGMSEFRGVIGTAVVRVFDLTVAKTGLTEKEAEDYGFDIVTSMAPGPDIYHHFPGRKSLRLKLIAEKNGKLLGAQAVGDGVVDKRIDILATAIWMEAEVEDVTGFDLAYSPPYSQVMDSVIHAANMIKNKLDGLVDSISIIELKNKFDSNEDFILLDVRTEEEFAKGHIPDSRVLNIPVEDLRESLHRLPDDREKEIIAVCQIGSRGYEAVRILSGAGYKNVKIADGCMALWSFNLEVSK